MSLAVARTKIMTSMKDLQVRWDEVTRYWDDPVAREFAKRHIEPLDGQSRAAVSAIENMSQIVARARNECGC